jgi:hypothetical protein
LNDNCEGIGEKHRADDKLCDALSHLATDTVMPIIRNGSIDVKKSM